MHATRCRLLLTPTLEPISCSRSRNSRGPDRSTQPRGLLMGPPEQRVLHPPPPSPCLHELDGPSEARLAACVTGMPRITAHVSRFPAHLSRSRSSSLMRRTPAINLLPTPTTALSFGQPPVFLPPQLGEKEGLIFRDQPRVTLLWSESICKILGLLF